MTILITNDDGYKSRGINVLYRAAKKVFGDDIAVVAPDKLQSSTGMSFTFHKPLRIEKLDYEEMPCLAVSGTPADCVFMSLNHLFKNKITMVLSGVNQGMNVGLDAVYSSGTVSAAMFASIYNIPSIAFSKAKSNPSSINTAIEDEDNFDGDIDEVYSHLVKFLMKIKKSGFPVGVELLNVNFPKLITENTKTKVVKTDRGIFEDLVDVKKDPHGREYYWLYGTLKRNLNKEGDVRSLLDGNITVTPIDLSAADESKMSTVKSMFYDTKT